MNLKLNNQKLWNKLRFPDYRNALVSSTIAARLAVRIYNLRKRAGWKQPELAERAGMKQARISVLEQGDYENFTFSTLKKLAAAFNVAVVVDFVSFPDFLKWKDNLSSESVAPDSFAESNATLARRAQVAASASGTYQEQGLAGCLGEGHPQINTQGLEGLLKLIDAQSQVEGEGARGVALTQPALLAAIEAK